MEHENASNELQGRDNPSKEDSFTNGGDFAGEILAAQGHSKNIGGIEDSFEVSDGKNTVQICIKPTKNRCFKTQIFLNGSEFRPSTFQGQRLAETYWKMLKGSNKN